MTPIPPSPASSGPSLSSRVGVYLALAVLVVFGWLHLFFTAPALMPAGRLWSAVDVLTVALMWCAMAVAMMLPTALPAILAYERRREPARHPPAIWLAAGYLVVWFGYALAAMLVQDAVTLMGSFSRAMAPAGPAFGASIYFAAGIYQFTPAKWLCLKRCRTPLGAFVGDPPDRVWPLFRLGLEEGLNCLGACWALMAVMFAVGLMNPLAMVALGILMGLEKIASGRWPTIAIGLLLLLAGVRLLVPLLLHIQ